MTMHFGRNFGFQLRRMMGSDRKIYLSGVIWRRRGSYLHYYYPCIRWF